MTRALFAVLPVLALVVGCGGPSYERTTVKEVSSSGLSSVVTLTQVNLRVGGATKAFIKPYNDDDEPMAGDVASDDPTILEVATGLDDGEYVFMGRRVGTTTVKFFADGKVVAIANAKVEPQ